MRLLTLYLRSRRVPATITAAVAGTALMWTMVAVFSPGRDADRTMVVLLVVLLVATVAPTLGSPDDALERTAALRWPPRRAVHLISAFALIVTLVLATLVLATLVTGARFGPAALVVRDAAGLIGLLGLGAAVLGTSRSWFPALVWTLPAVMFPFSGTAVAGQVLTWQSQPPGNHTTSIAAAVIAAAGLLVHAMRGPAPRDSARSTP